MKHPKPEDNRIALTLDSGNLDEAVLRVPVPANRKQARQLYEVKQHFWMDTPKLGYDIPLYFHCWCSGKLLMDYTTNGIEVMADKFNNFCNSHEACEPNLEENEGEIE